MRTPQLLFILLCMLAFGCNRPWLNEETKECACNPSEDNGVSYQMEHSGRVVKGALLASRFETFEEFQSVVQIEYFNVEADANSAENKDAVVRLKHCSSGKEVISVLQSGIDQDDIIEARDGDYVDKLRLAIASPFAAANRMDLVKVYTLSRWRPLIYGEGDVAFFDLAKTAVNKISSKASYQNQRDSSEKGFLNSFNHITAQSIITSCFSEELADFLADVHELHNMSELTSGIFTEEQLMDPNNNPVDNYVDLINNEWGQEIGKQLKIKYNITRDTYWTPELLTNYLNDLQHYYMWAFQIEMEPFRPEDDVVARFSRKFNLVMKEGGSI